MKLIALISAWLLLAVCAVAQTSTPHFPTTNAYWIDDLGCFESYYKDTYTCTDTVIDGASYTKLMSQFYAPAITLAPYFNGAVRAEGLKLYYKPKPGAAESLVYDFSVQAGDTIRLARHFIYWGDYTDTLQQVLFTITKVDSVQLDDGWHKRWRANCNLPSYQYEIWIDGIGSTYGLVDRFICGIYPNVAKTKCLVLNGQPYYTLNPGAVCENLLPAECQVTVGAAQQFSPASAARVYPNPFSDYLDIALPEEQPVSWQVHLFDISGREIPVIRTQSANGIRIERNSLPSGVYFLKIERSGGQSLSRTIRVMVD